jgi:hypothetical protein
MYECKYVLKFRAQLWLFQKKPLERAFRRWSAFCTTVAGARENTWLGYINLQQRNNGARAEWLPRLMWPVASAAIVRAMPLQMGLVLVRLRTHLDGVAHCTGLDLHFECIDIFFPPLLCSTLRHSSITFLESVL